MSSHQLEPPSLIRQRPILTPLQPVQAYSIDDEEYSDDDDIYRGDRPPSARPSTPSTIRSSSSLSSSSGSPSARGQLGALASVDEQAITRWARSAGGGSSPSSSSSSLSKSSRLTTSRPSGRRRRRRSSVSSLPTVNSEKDIAARITRMKALEESRQIPRQFILYLPPSHSLAHAPSRVLRDSDGDDESRRVTETSSLSLVLGQLDFALKRATKARRHLHTGAPRHSRSLISRPLRQPGRRDCDKGPRSSSSGPHPHSVRKGKDREASGNDKRRIRFAEPVGKVPKAWFLDIASPNWEDLKAVGKLLHLHPLTLDDILQQDPREKLDLFPKLGYYFVSFRAIETRDGREKSQRQLQKMNEYLEPIAGHREGAVGESNVYLVVFSEGICCFHYNDVAEHTDRIRNRITLLGEVATMSSDWIAHGILDSIVDSFFPYLEEIEKEVMAIEELVFPPIGVDEATASTTKTVAEKSPKGPSSQSTLEKGEKLHLPMLAKETISSSEKSQHLEGTARARFAAPQWTLSLVFRRVRRFLTKHWSHRSNIPETPSSATTLTLRRMARARRLVTSLNRLLASKSEVITQIRKRLLKAGTSGLGEGTKAEGLEVAIYMGDVQDHILTLQHSLNHYERMLSKSHPTYLSQLRTTFANSKSGTDKNLVYLSALSIAVLSMQAFSGIFSMNVTLPSNETGFSVFGVVLALAILIFCVYINLVRYWWKQAGRRKRALS